MCARVCVCSVCMCCVCVCTCVCVRVCVLKLLLLLQCTSSPLSPDPSTRTIHRLNPSISSLPSLSSSSFSPSIPSFSFLHRLSMHSPSFIPSSLPSFHSPSLLPLPPPLTARSCPLYNASSSHTNFKKIK